MFMKISLGIILCLVIALGIAGTLLRSAWQDVAELKVLYASQQAETQKVINDLNSVKLEHMRQITEATAQLKERQRDVTALRKQTQTIRNTTSSLEAALKREPERAGRAVTYLNARGLREICRASGGTAADCKISLPKSTTARPRAPSKSGGGTDSVLDSQEVSDGKPAVHPQSRLGEHESVQ